METFSAAVWMVTSVSFLPRSLEFIFWEALSSLWLMALWWAVISYCILLYTLYGQRCGHLSITTKCTFWTSHFRFSVSFALTITSALMQRLSIRFWNVDVIFCPFNHKSISVIKNRCQVRRPRCSSSFQLFSEAWRLGHLSSSTPTLVEQV